MSLLNKENEDIQCTKVHILNPFVHTIKLENTFDKFKVRTKTFKVKIIKYHCGAVCALYFIFYINENVGET